ncbi:hypothetical protein DZC30_01355 [Comamonas testosteroni]|uniref:Uncharacterized protein n=1 Tax=Comamonas testosteroni TaxID=285 RepID=A0A373FSC9_COMTE|nr:hypothetical protein [Comamonas testosteroni]RGE47071.1 hypothetical protein DZC30_01355 [Comamonas testosteroni]
MYFTISIQLQIVLAICLFYLYDAALLLKPEEGLLRRSSRRHRWLGLLASRGFELRQNWLLWPPIFLPHQPIYRLRWNAAQISLPGDAQAAQTLNDHASSFRAFTLPLYLLAALLFIALPVSLLVLHSELAQLISLALIYLCTASLSLLALRHARHGHSPKAVARSTALQILLCPPFALNVVRKLSLAHEVQTDLLQSAHALMDADQWGELSAQVEAVMQREMQEIAELPEYAEHVQKMQQGLELLKLLHAHPPGRH